MHFIHRIVCPRDCPPRYLILIIPRIPCPVVSGIVVIRHWCILLDPSPRRWSLPLTNPYPVCTIRHCTNPLPPTPQDTGDYNPPPLAPSGPLPPTDVPSLGQQYAPPPSYATPTSIPPSANMPSSFTGLLPQVTLTLNPAQQVLLMTGLPPAASPSLLQRPPSEPPLISFD